MEPKKRSKNHERSFLTSRCGFTIKSNLMSIAPNSKHPLFVRLGQRDTIFKQTLPSSLCIETEDQALISDFIKLFELPISDQATRFNNSDNHYPKVFAHLLSTHNLPDSLSLICAFIDRLLDFDFCGTIKSLLPLREDIIKSCTKILNAHSSQNQQYPFLIRTILLLQGTLLSESDEIDSSEVYTTFLNTTIKLLSSFSQATLALDGLKRFLRCEGYRIRFVEADGINLLLNNLVQARNLPHTDTLYHILFCLWALTYTAEGAGYLSENRFVSELAKLLTTIQPEREDIVRLLTFIITELNSSPLFIESAYDNDILKLFRGFQGKHYIDSELNKQIAQAAETLHTELRRLSLWDKYLREIFSGVLRNTQTHKSDIFWKTNIERFNENDYAAIRQLKELLTTGDEETIEVACHDLGEYASRHPLGKKRLEKEGVKEAVMGLLAHQSQRVQLEALRTTQLLLIQSQ